jgi:inward rectifier potassium channel
VRYGAMYPRTVPAQIVVSVEIFVGLISLAILTGLMFSRFAKPTSRVLFSEVAVVCPFDGIPTLMFRKCLGLLTNGIIEF